MVLEYSPRISGTRHGFRVRKGMRRCYKVRIIVLGCAPGVLEYAQVTHRTVYERCQFVFLFFYCFSSSFSIIFLFFLFFFSFIISLFYFYFPQ